jgi:hypothetical protein
LLTIAAAGNKIIFAGGQFDNGADYQSTDLVDIYDIVTHTWTTAHLSSPRYSIAAITVGNKIYLAGGRSNWLGSLGWDQFRKVDIYDAATDSWSTADLSSSRTALSIEKVGNKLLFAGGREEFPFTRVSTTVDVLDLVNNTWSITNLNTGRSDMGSAVIGNKVYFAGGNKDVGPFNATQNATSQIDIYDNNSGTWSAALLSEPRSNFAAIEYAGNIYYAGGEKYFAGNPSIQSASVEIFESSSGQTSFSCLFQPNSWFDAVIDNNRLVFFTGGGAWGGGGPDHSRFDIYDPATNTWSIGKLGRDLTYTGILNTGNLTYIAGGYNNGVVTDEVFKLQF